MVRTVQWKGILFPYKKSRKFKLIHLLVRRKATPAGLVLSSLVLLVYFIALTFFEGPFTTRIYLERDAAQERKSSLRVKKQ